MSLALVLAIAGIGLLVAAALLLRSLGLRSRLGRILAATPEASLAEAIALAAGPAVYVRVKGRITSDEEFPDEHDRPLVFRRKRVELAEAAGRWRTVLDEREAVPFGIELRGEFVAVDEAALGPGLIAIPREARGQLSDLPPSVVGEAVSGLDPDLPARLVIEQLSAVEHATVCGRPVMRDGQPMLTGGAGRPLIVTTLEEPAAMRLLASGGRRRAAAAAIALLIGMGLLAAAVVALLAGL